MSPTKQQNLEKITKTQQTKTTQEIKFKFLQAKR